MINSHASSALLMFLPCVLLTFEYTRRRPALARRVARTRPLTFLDTSRFATSNSLPSPPCHVQLYTQAPVGATIRSSGRTLRFDTLTGATAPDRGGIDDLALLISNKLYCPTHTWPRAGTCFAGGRSSRAPQAIDIDTSRRQHDFLHFGFFHLECRLCYPILMSQFTNMKAESEWIASMHGAPTYCEQYEVSMQCCMCTPTLSPLQGAW